MASKMLDNGLMWADINNANQRKEYKQYITPYYTWFQRKNVGQELKDFEQELKDQSKQFYLDNKLEKRNQTKQHNMELSAVAQENFEKWQNKKQ